MATFVWCFLFAFHLSHCIRGGVNGRNAWRETKCDWHLGGGEEYPLPPPFPLLSPCSRDEERGRGKKGDDRRPPQAFSLVADESSFSSANRATRIFDFHSGEGKGHLPDSHVLPKRIAFSHYRATLIDPSLLLRLIDFHETSNVPFFFFFFSFTRSSIEFGEGREIGKRDKNCGELCTRDWAKRYASERAIVG